MQLAHSAWSAVACQAPPLGAAVRWLLMLPGWRRAGARWRRTTRPAASAAWRRCRARSGCTTTEQGEWVAAERNRPLTRGDRAVHRGRRLAPSCASARPRCGWARSTELEALRLDDERMQFALLRGSWACALRSRRGRGGTGSCPARRPLRCRSAPGCTASTGRTRPATPAVSRGELRVEAPQPVDDPVRRPARRVLARRAAGDTAQPVAGPAARRLRAGLLQRRTRPIARSAAAQSTCRPR